MIGAVLAVSKLPTCATLAAVPADFGYLPALLRYRLHLRYSLASSRHNWLRRFWFRNWTLFPLDRRNFRDLRCIGQPHIFISLAASDDPIIESDARLSAAQFTNFKASSVFVCDVETFAVPLWSYENVVINSCVNRVRKCILELDVGHSTGELTRAEVLEPIFGGLYGIDLHFLVVVRGNDRGQAAAAAERSVRQEIAESAVKGGHVEDERVRAGFLPVRNVHG